MKFILSVFFIALLSFIVGSFGPWWSIAVVSFLVSFVIRQRPGFSFLSAFSAIFLLWSTLAIWYDVNNKSILSHKIALILPLGGSPALIILLTAFAGALVAGFAGMTGSSLRS